MNLDRRRSCNRTRTLLPALALALLLPLLAGGGAGSPATVAAQEPVTLDVWIFEGEEHLLPALEEAFEAENPNVNVEITLIPEDQYVVKIDTALAAGSPPDIGYLYDRRWVKAGKILPLDETIAAHEIDLEDLNQGIIGNCTIDGQVYCLGSYTGAVPLLYNKTMFDEAGLDYPSADRADDDRRVRGARRPAHRAQRRHHAAGLGRQRRRALLVDAPHQHVQRGRPAGGGLRQRRADQAHLSGPGRHGPGGSRAERLDHGVVGRRGVRVPLPARASWRW